MPKIIPAILTDNLETFKTQIKQMEGATDWVQIDVSDGIFVPQKTLAAEEIKTVITNLKYELHLMVTDPTTEIEKWYDLSNVKRIIFHFEAAKIPIAVIKHIEAYGFDAGVAVNPDTGLENLEALAYQADLILFMAVTPGKQGQKFIPETLNKIKEFKNKYPQMPVAVDGGVHQEEIKQLATLGVEYLDVGSEIFANPNPREHLKELQHLIYA
ncbi:MAG TPA: ribulose-phosphate 3-epimerase [Candidatus Magasanikbacteria bacterium]|uniref:Ribulose-phosphate 3-epimerase n=1 Tax=Candidatus Magasanikbacteria bacterium GW2011_GWC2_41_17 TaxID=1619048 RepID=A0A0G0XPA6_9BACT|nr:MAG: Ribulose-phosphate 3-epimerase [Candidatus Magasanikbacteria bacterium GW2011_GWC2_41_17]HBV58143.1 ribulose-phosphate 3-epimerase [Candidatus Magasanikbacteria bacterium]HBX16439.1 ribulose-phosphate 3-epimerase [Candidatus Magasanikbacteria bacterium]